VIEVRVVDPDAVDFNTPKYLGDTLKAEDATASRKKLVAADEYAGTLSRGTAFLSHPKKQKIVPIPVNGEKSLASASSATWK